MGNEITIGRSTRGDMRKLAQLGALDSRHGAAGKMLLAFEVDELRVALRHRVRGRGGASLPSHCRPRRSPADEGGSGVAGQRPAPPVEQPAWAGWLEAAAGLTT
jgi:hypothetical protein